MKKFYLLTLLLVQLGLVIKTNAQNIAINATGSLPDTSAMLDISSTTKGLLAPRMTTTQQNAIPLPANGLLIFNTTDNVFKVNTGTPGVPLWTPLAMGSGVAITSLNGLTPATQTFATGTSGTDFGISSSGTVHTFNIPTASATNRGALSASDWASFNAKLGLTSLSATAPLSYNNLTGAFSISQATTSTSGYLNNTDWNTFNGKAPLASPTFTGTPAAPTAAPGTSTTQLATTAFVAAANGTNANLTGPITSVGNATSVTSQTGTGTTFAMSASPTFTGTPAAPTAAPGTSTTQLATTAFVAAANGTNANLTGPITSVGNATSITNNAVTYAKIQAMTANKLLGSGLSGTAVSEITLGTGLSFTGTTLNAATTGGTVTTVSVVNTNGLTGSVANATTTPAITLGTSISGLLKGNGTAISAATAGTDYQAPIALTTTGASGAASFGSNTLNIPNYTLAGLGGIGLTALSASAPLSYNNTTGAFSISQASGSSNGYLSSADWTTFNSKQGSLTGTANRITVASGAIDISSAYVGQNSITTLGTVGTGTWQGTAVGAIYGGTGQTTVATGDLLYGSAANTWSKLAAGTNGQILTLAGGVPTWAANPGATAWNVTGNAATAGSHFLGTTNNVSLRMRTNNVERMVVDSLGNVGIGTTSPTQVLQVSGQTDGTAIGPLLVKSATGQGSIGVSMTLDNTAATGGYKYSLISTGPSAGGGAGQLGIYGGAGPGYVFRVNSNGQSVAGLNGTTYLGQLTAYPYNATTPGIVVQGFTSQSANLQEWRNASSTVLAEVSASGKMGINQLTPTALLHLGAGTAAANTAPLKFAAGTNLTTPENGAVEFNGTHFYGTVGTTRYQLDQQAVGTNWSLTGNTPTAGSHFLGSTNNVSLRFRTNNTERMIIDSTGNVGVGLTDPTAGYYLAVKDNLEIRRTATTAQMIFTNTAGSGNFRIGGDGGDIFWQGGGGQSLQMGSYWATVLGGDRQTAAFPAFIGGITGTSVIVAAQRDASVALGIQPNSASQTANLTEWRNSGGTALSVVDASGNVGIGTNAPNSPLQIDGSLATAVASVNSNTTLSAANSLVLVSTGNFSDKTITLPDATTCTGRIYSIKKIDNGSKKVIVDGNAGQTIDGATTYTSLSARWKYLTIQSDGSNWQIIGNN